MQDERSHWHVSGPSLLSVWPISVFPSFAKFVEVAELAILEWQGGCSQKGELGVHKRTEHSCMHCDAASSVFSTLRAKRTH